MRPPIAIILAATLAAILPGCGSGSSSKAGLPAAPDKITVSSPAFQGGGTIPQQFTCDGPNVSPPLEFSGVPGGADSLALVMEDRDAPGGRFVHWSLYEISTGQKTIAQGTVPAGASEGQNSFGKTGYGGPCPPKDNPPHRYVIAVYALSASPDLKAGAKPDDVFTAIERTAVSRGLLEATYGR